LRSVSVSIGIIYCEGGIRLEKIEEMVITLMIADLILNVSSMFLVVNSDREFILSTKVYLLNFNLAISITPI